MAETAAYYRAQMDAKQATYSEFDDLSTSITAIHNLAKDVVAEAAAAQSALFDTFKTEIDAKVTAARNPNDEWFYERAVAFQYGDLLTVVDGEAGYLVVDAEKQIISRCAIVPGDKTVTIKVAKGEDYPEQLTTEELLAYKSYWNQRQPRGLRLVIISIPADKLKLTGTVLYDPLIPVATVQASFTAAVQEYLKGIRFNGQHENEKLDTALKAVSGVNDFNLAKFMKDSSSDYAEIERDYDPLSGYYIYDEDNSSITFEADV